MTDRLRTLERARTEFQDVVVRGNSRQTELQVEGAVHAWRHRDRFLSMAWGAMAAAALLRPAGPPRSILMLGLAGGTVFRILRHLLPVARLEAVEIDSGIVALGRRHMALDELNLRVHLADAKPWLARNRRRFDVVIDDCYLAGREDVFRPHGLDEDVQADLLRALAPGGALVVNLVTGSGHRRLQSAYRGWFRRHFDDCRGLTVPDSQNEILVGGDGLLGKRALGAWAGCFFHRDDLKKWSEIQARRI